jgi:transposase-like protein
MMRAILHYFARMLCLLFGHKRGKRVSEVDGVPTFRCPRCGSYWTRKNGKRKAAQ